MKETLISYETATLSKEKGFDEFDENNNRVFCEVEHSVFFHKPVQNHHEDSYNANYKFRCPTQAFLQTWLRDEHKIHIEMIWDFENVIWYTCITYIGNVERDEICDIENNSPTYEEALELGLQQALQLL